MTTCCAGMLGCPSTPADDDGAGTDTETGTTTGVETTTPIDTTTGVDDTTTTTGTDTEETGSTTGGPGQASILINEVLVDPIGFDSDPSGPRDGGHEIIELVNVGEEAVDLDGWSLRDQDGNELYTFDAPTEIPGTGRGTHHLLVVLGTETPALAARMGTFDDVEPTNAVVFDDANTGDRLLSDAGAISLRDAAGDLVDAVLWGESDPSGDEVDAILAEGHWSGGAVSTAVSAGSAPLVEEEGTLGRGVDSSDTDSVTDWRTHGGPDGLGSSLGYANRPWRFQTPLGFVHEIQGYVNEMAAMLSINNSPEDSQYLAITDASYDNLVIVENGDELTIEADHTFDYDSNGTPGTLQGAITIQYVPAAGASDQMMASGTLTDPVSGLQMDISIVEDVSGFGTNEIIKALDLDLTWDDGAATYDYSILASRVETWTSQTTVEITDQRDWTDWSTTDAKTATGTWVIEHTADGVTDTTGFIERSNPFYPSAFGDTNPVGPSTHRVELAFETMRDADGQLDRTYTQLDMSLVGATNQILFVQLDPTGTATASLTRTAGTVGDRLGTFTEQLDLPLILLQGGVAPEPHMFSSTATLVLDTRTSPDGDLVLTEDYTLDLTDNGAPDLHLEYFVDGWRFWVAKAVKVVTAGLCTAGAGLTAPSVVGAVGFVAGSTIVYEIWDVVESQDPG